MIKASELRIGNIFNYWPIGCGLVPDKVNALRIKSETPAQRLIKGERSGWNQETQCHPIPLTAEIIEKHGGLSNVGLMRISSNYSDDVQYFWEVEGQIIGKEIKYVHELQNIFYAINREELNIKL